MTDVETIKGLECHIGNRPQDDCEFCPYHKYGATSCLEMLLQDATALAIRKNAEIESLNSDITSLNNTIQNLLLTVSKTKESTIEEFIEKLEAKLQKRALFSVIDTIHEVAAEMRVDIE